ncbi:TMEM175 family protein, partial [Bacillus safensis]|uniref:TMEM175 family protein n=1 Tax=Bacillus safensis TaxID=561879 RepID=UPI002DD44627
FVLIATFWMEHHRQYQRVRRLTPGLLWVNVGWMLTIVWLPVPTAMLGQMEPDPLQAVLYIGTLILTQVATLAGKLYLL